MSSELASITNVINLYAIAVDSHRYELLEQVFTPDVQCDVGGGAVFTDRATLISVFADIHAVFDATQHMTSGHTIALDGDRANCMSYVAGRFRREIDGSPAVFESMGWYDDVLVRLPEGWRIAERKSRMVSYGGEIRVMQAMPGIDTKYELVSLFEEADAGRIRFFAR